MSWLGGLLGAVVLVAASPLLARWTLTAPDRDRAGWWTGRGVRPTRRRAVTTAVLAAIGGALAGCAGGDGATGGWSWPAWIALAVVLTPLAAIDAEHHRLPIRFVVPGYLAGALLLLGAAIAGHDLARWERAVAAAAVVFAVFFTLAFAAPASLGFGDVTLSGLLAGYLGWQSWAAVLSGLLLGFVLGALMGLGLLITRRGGLRSHLAFGPPLMLGALLVSAFG